MTIGTYGVKNQPIWDIVPDAHGGAQKLYIGTSPGASDLFNGIIYPNPNEYPNLNIDFQPYIYDLVSMFKEHKASADVGFDFGMTTNTNHTISTASRNIYFEVRNVSDNGQNLSQSVKLLNKNLTTDEYRKFLLKKPFGRFEEFTANPKPDSTYVFDTYLTFKPYDDIVLYSFIKPFDISVIPGSPRITRGTNKTLANAPIFFGICNLFDGTGTSLNFNLFSRFHNGPMASNVGGSTVSTTNSYAYGNFIFRSITLPTLPWDGFYIHIQNENYGQGKNRVYFFRRVMPCNSRETYQLYWINRRGGMDWMVLNGKSVISNEFERYSHPINRYWTAGSSSTLSIDKQSNKMIATYETKKYDLNSGYLYEEDYRYLKDIMVSPGVFIYSPYDETITAVDVLDSDFTFKNFKNDKMFNFNIKLKDQYNERYY